MLDRQWNIFLNCRNGSLQDILFLWLFFSMCWINYSPNSLTGFAQTFQANLTEAPRNYCSSTTCDLWRGVSVCKNLVWLEIGLQYCFKRCPQQLKSPIKSCHPWSTGPCQKAKRHDTVQEGGESRPGRTLCPRELILSSPFAGNPSDGAPAASLTHLPPCSLLGEFFSCPSTISHAIIQVHSSLLQQHWMCEEQVVLFM